ncbi:hypothetical protein [Planomicrobium sp. CPCC 101079]|uniref:hypothetical protein n=1 Tax=Planomicrobium sp. CPCC 101079 TaxID=2599618 RepID=UPI0011B638F3|nr:hypothetical protein [Planomicrobium sp. CPCC 101079]TWT13171.1 hypothetical protein FQV28_03270 [Planomicrobium sp. CPCC 101079]
MGFPYNCICSLSTKRKKNFSLQEWVFNGVILGIVLLVVGGLSFTIKDYDFSINEKQWKESYLDPYIKALPENKEYVEDFSQIVTGEEDAIKSIYINDKVKPITVEIITLNKENELTKKTPVQVVLQKEPIKNPYLTYKTIEKDISSEYTTKQNYETILHIPEDYKVIAPTK